MEEGEMTPMDMRDSANPLEECDPRRRRRCLVTGLSLCVVVLVIVIATVAGKNKAMPKYASVSEENQKLYSLVEGSMVGVRMDIGKSIPSDDLLLIGSYQNKAFNWLAGTPDLEDIDHTRKLQRFALACFYYATYQSRTKYNHNPGPWDDESHWMSYEHECDWLGVVCKTDGRVQSISLEHNDLSGKLPLELGLLWESLKVLKLSFNGITMEGDDWNVFGYLPYLEKLALSANHVVSTTGVPEQLLECVYLRKLLLSDNMMSGPLENGVLGDMQKLSK